MKSKIYYLAFPVLAAFAMVLSIWGPEALAQYKDQGILDRPHTENVENAGEGAGLAPIGHVVSVKSADPVQAYITTSVTFNEGYNWTNTNTLIREAIDSYLLELRKEWADSSNIVVRVSQIETRILGVDGVLDVTNTKINGSANNLTLTKYQIPVLGGVSA